MRYLSLVLSLLVARVAVAADYVWWEGEQSFQTNFSKQNDLSAANYPSARELLSGAVAYAKKRGVGLLEAYPVDKELPSAADASWFGSKRMFDQAGFDEVARRRRDRPVVRLRIG